MEFVPVAEQTGQARALTTWVLDNGLEQLSAWRDAGALDLHLAINLTVADLLDVRALPESIGAALAARRLPPEALVVEVTETSVLADPVRVGAVLERIGELGVGVALDDFGTGYSSLTHLKQLPVTEVKVDRSFVAQMDVDHADAAIVASTDRAGAGARDPRGRGGHRGRFDLVDPSRAGLRPDPGLRVLTAAARGRAERSFKLDRQPVNEV